MTITPVAQSEADLLRQKARDHLMLHFTRMGGHEPSIIVRGEGCYLEDIEGRRYLDALAGLFAVQVGYSFGEELGQAALEQMRELPFYTNWSYAHPRAIELAGEVAALAPGNLNRVFFVSGGSEAVESAWKRGAEQPSPARTSRRARRFIGFDAFVSTPRVREASRENGARRDRPRSLCTHGSSRRFG